MQLFTCPFDNDTSHVRLYLTLGMPLCRMTHICCHRNRRFQHGLCNWSWWIWPFLDNGAAQLRGHQRALTLLAADVPAACHPPQAEEHRLTSTHPPPLTPAIKLIMNFVYIFKMHTPKPQRTNLAACSPLPHLPLSRRLLLFLFPFAQPAPSDGSLLPLIWEGALPPSFHSPSAAHSSNHGALVNTLSKWVMRCN